MRTGRPSPSSKCTDSERFRFPRTCRAAADKEKKRGRIRQVGDTWAPVSNCCCGHRQPVDAEGRCHTGQRSRTVSHRGRSSYETQVRHTAGMAIGYSLPTRVLSPSPQDPGPVRAGGGLALLPSTAVGWRDAVHLQTGSGERRQMQPERAKVRVQGWFCRGNHVRWEGGCLRGSPAF